MKRTILRHPRTGAPLVPLGYGKRGPIWPILGAADDDGSQEEPDDSGDDKAGDKSADKDTGGKGGDGSQEEPDDGGDGFDAAKALEKIKKLNSENSNLRKRAKEAEDKAKGADGSSERIKALEAENLRYRVGVKNGLPDWLIDRLKGDTEEEILADAEKLLQNLNAGKGTSRKPAEKLRGGGDPTDEPDESDPAKLAAKVRRGY